MSTARRLQAMYESKQQEWESVHERLTSLRQARTIETDPENKFKFDQRIKTVEKELKVIQNELTQLEHQISQLKPEEGKSSSSESLPSVKERYKREVINPSSYGTSPLPQRDQKFERAGFFQHLEYASVGQRLVAFILDMIICGVAFFYIVNFTYSAVYNEQISYDPVANIIIFSTTAVVVGYHTILETGFGATLGKGIAGITIITLDGNRISFGASLSRIVLKALSIAFLGLGIITTGIALLNSPTKQGFHDSWTDTIVVTKRSLGR